jgi:hypothetical protein
VNLIKTVKPKHKQIKYWYFNAILVIKVSK